MFFILHILRYNTGRRKGMPDMSLVMKETAQSLLLVFAIIAFGYMIGAIKIKGISLGTAAIFLSGLLFGHFGAKTPAVLQTVGLILFITSVGLSAGPSFFSLLKRNGLSYIVLCLTIAASGATVCFAVIRLGHVEAPLAVGIMTGSFTTSPGFAAAKEAVTTAEAVTHVAAGYGVAYPVGVICKVLTIQLIPKLLHADMVKERALIALPVQQNTEKTSERRRLDSWGLLPFSLAVVMGILLGSVTLALPGGGSFSLGTTGGPLIVGLLIGHIGHLGRIDLRPSEKLYGPAKEIGLILFFSGAGVEGGHGLAEILSVYGPSLLLYALLLVLIPLTVGYLVSRYVLKLPLLNGLGSITASMTCTPSLAVLIQAAGTDDVAAAYATTYPIALITLVLLVQFLVAL